MSNTINKKNKSKDTSRCRKAKPRKYNRDIVRTGSIMSIYSDYKWLRLRERIRRSQVDYIENRNPFVKLFHMKFEPDAIFK